MVGKTFYIADDFSSINKALKQIEGAFRAPEQKAPIKCYCSTCVDAGYVRSVSNRWKTCGVCGNPKGKPQPTS